MQSWDYVGASGATGIDYILVKACLTTPIASLGGVTWVPAGPWHGRPRQLALIRTCLTEYDVARISTTHRPTGPLCDCHDDNVII